MGERDKDQGREFGLAAADQAARERERKLKMLKRLGEALDRPVEDFYEASSKDIPSQDEPSSKD